jgi:hypothetical protein
MVKRGKHANAAGRCPQRAAAPWRSPSSVTGDNPTAREKRRNQSLKRAEYHPEPSSGVNTNPGPPFSARNTPMQRRHHPLVHLPVDVTGRADDGRRSRHTPVRTDGTIRGCN